MDDEHKLQAIHDEMIAAYEKLAEAILKGKDATALQLEALAKRKELAEKILEIEKKQTEEDEKKKRAREAYLDKYRNFLEAQNSVADAEQKARDAHHDALALTVDEAASGKRGTSKDRALARRIQRDEARARSLFSSGHNVVEFDFARGRNVTHDAEFFQNRALQMRQKFERLKTSEQNPFAAAEAQLKEANTHLKEMERALKPEKVD